MTLELVILFPVILMIIFGALQAGLYFHARSVALAAAQEGLREARAENGTASAGGAAAENFVLQVGGDDVMKDVTVTPSRSATRARVIVEGRPLSVLPGVLNFKVRQVAAAPVERFTEPGGS